MIIKFQSARLFDKLSFRLQYDIVDMKVSGADVSGVTGGHLGPPGPTGGQ